MFSHRIDEGLELTLPEPAMAEEIAAVVRANIDHLRPWVPWATEDYNAESAAEFIRKTLSDFAHDGRFSAAILVDKQFGGAIGYHRLDTANRSASVGYWIDSRLEGRGIVSRCCSTLIDYLFEVRDLNRIQINCNVNNTRSRAVPERLGFTLEGIQREVEYNNGKFGDWAIYALLRRDWEAGKSRNIK
jgi:ribosomal-protein-serine acetyltransferase